MSVCVYVLQYITYVHLKKKNATQVESELACFRVTLWEHKIYRFLQIFMPFKHIFWLIASVKNLLPFLFPVWNVCIVKLLRSVP